MAGHEADPEEAWFERAEQDLETARHLFAAEDVEPMMFFLQQSIEKALKSLLIAEQGDYERTHNLVRLGAMADVPDRFSDILEELTPFYAAVRYPDTPDITIETPETYITQTEELLKWIRKQ